MAQLTPTMRAALTMLHEHGGEGVRTNRRTMLAAGVELGQYAGDELMEAYSWRTWSKLRAGGFLEEVARLRFRITDAGLAVIAGRA